MTDLTEQLYAGTLPTGHYYFNNGVETYIVLYKNINSKHLILQEPEGLTVISEVPSYEEYQALLSDQLAKNEGVEINSELKAIIKKREIKIKELYETIDKFADSNLDLIKNIENLAQKLLQVKPELREWLEVNYKEYL